MNFKKSILGLSLLMTGLGCGNSQSGALVTPPNNTAPGTSTTSALTGTPTPVSCSAGTISIGGRPCVTGSFTEACSQSGGLIKSISSKQVCQLTSAVPQYFMSGTGAAFPRLSSSDPSGVYSYQTGIRVFKTDKVKTTASGGWGSIDANIKDYLGGFFSTITFSGNCDDISMTGSNSDGKTITNKENGDPAALYISDGIQAYLAGKSTTQVMLNDGYLRFGVNAPLTGNKCSSFAVQFQVTHCEDAAGVSISCL